MTVRAKAKGNRREHQAIRILEAAGYACTKSGGSLGVFDIIAIGRSGMRCIQVKSNRWPCPAEMESIELFPVPAGCSKEVWRFDDYKRHPSIKELG